MIKTVFPTFIDESFLSLDNEDFIKESLKQRDLNPNNYRDTSYGGVWKSPFEYGKNISPIFDKLTDEILIKSEILLREIGVDLDNYKVSLSNSWIIHQTCFLSGVYYIKCSKGCGNLVFKSPLSVNNHILGYEMVQKHTNYTNPLLHVVPVPGKLVMFPGWLEHYVESNSIDEPRISFAFNVSVKKKG